MAGEEVELGGERGADLVANSAAPRASTAAKRPRLEWK
jgi:hypothetical protein